MVHGMASRLVLLKALVKSKKTVQQRLGVEEDRSISLASLEEVQMRVKPDRWRWGPRWPLNSDFIELPT